jgi:glycerol-3-phosphate O-acyltransferase
MATEKSPKLTPNAGDVYTPRHQEADVEPISRKYRDDILRMMAVTQGLPQVTDKNVHQPGNPDLLRFIDKIVADNLLPGSGINGPEHLFELLAAAKSGEPCLLLLEHYSNFDLPVLHYLLRQSSEEGRNFAESLIAVAGIKLNETNSAVSAFSEAFSRLVIYPSRSLEIIKRNYLDPKELVAEMMRSSTVNRAAMRALAELKTSGNIILVFPSGTRFRPWDPTTKRGVREIDSYIKSFSKMCLVAVNGNILRLNPEGSEMEEDLICQDRVQYTVSPVMDCADFRARVKHEHRFREDKKQAVVDEIMAQLDRIHEAAEKDRLRPSGA